MKFDCNRYFVFGVLYILGMIVLGIEMLGKFFEAYIFTEQALVVLVIMCIVPFIVGYKSEVVFKW
jgi:hypothetical protein